MKRWVRDRLITEPRGRKIDLANERIVKFVPANPPHLGEVVLVDGERCRVTSATIMWDGPRWELLGLRVKLAGGERDE